MPRRELDDPRIVVQPRHEPIAEHHRDLQVMRPEEVRQIRAPQILRHGVGAVHRLVHVVIGALSVVPPVLVPRLLHGDVRAELHERIDHLPNGAAAPSRDRPLQVHLDDLVEPPRVDGPRGFDPPKRPRVVSLDVRDQLVELGVVDERAGCRRGRAHACPAGCRANFSRIRDRSSPTFVSRTTSWL